MITDKNIYSAVYFDLDSTLVDIEGLDEIANSYKKKKSIAWLTEKAMAGDVKLEDVFALKLAMIRPKKSDFLKLGRLYIKHVVEDAKDVISTFKYLKKDVIIMTGNFYPAVIQLARYLGISDKNVFANQIIFDKIGNYVTFDSKGPLSIAGGKRSLMLILKRDNRKVVFIGDGLPDALTRPPVDMFMGYGGVVTRQLVVEKSDIYIKCRSLSVMLPYILNKKEKIKIGKTKFNKLLKKGEVLIKKGFTICR